jgi:hypothetical protein
MSIRYYTLINVLSPSPEFVKKTIAFLIILFVLPIYAQNTPSLNEVKKEAAKLFEEENYTKAYSLYSQLVSNYPKDPEYNYKLGVCMIYSEADKKKCLPYLQLANKNITDETKDAAFYLGKAYHVNYLFNEAIENYNAFKKTASSSRQKKLQVDREIKSCMDGKNLLSNLTDLVVQSKKQLNEADYFRSYDLKSIGGKLLVKPDDFKTGVDKKKKEKSIVFLPKSGNRIYFSSYGDNADNGKDIYYAVKMADGNYSKPQKVKIINTEFDEDYPFLHPNGQTLYFASKGHNSMGGYDIFKSNYIEASDLEFPINSPDDDYLFVTDSLEKTAYFSTGRQSPHDKIDVLKINTERKPIDVVVIKGNVTKETPEQSLESTIRIENLEDKKPIASYSVKENGEYDMELPNGAKLLFTVETPGLKTQSQEVLLPVSLSSKPFKQNISYNSGILKITNYFDEPASDDNYLQYLKVIEKKAKLEVNEGENNLTAESVASTNPDIKKDTSPQLIDQSAVTATSTVKDPKQGLDNKQLANMAKADAKESLQEAQQLKQDSNDALEVGEMQKISADKKLITAGELIKNAEAIENLDERKTAIDKANLLKIEAENEAAMATKILQFAKSLGDDADTKLKEAQLNDEYAKELEKAISTKNNQESLAKLDDLQKQINELSSKKNESENLFNAIKSDIEEKENQIKALEKTNGDIKSNLEEIKTAVVGAETDLAKAKKKKEKESLTNQLNELKTEQSEKENQVVANDETLKKLNDELLSLKNELDLTNKIKTETIAAPVNLASNTATQTIKEDKQALATNTKTTTKKTNAVIQKNIPTKETNKPDYTPLTASTNAEAIAKLDKLGTQLTANDNEIFDFNGYQNPQAQSLKIEADAKINEAIAQQKKLKDVITTSSDEIKNSIPANNTNDVVSSQQLNKEAEDLIIKAQGIRNDAAAKPEEEKNKLIDEAKTLETNADEKYLQAADITKKDNKAFFDVNTNNIENLAAQNKSTDIELQNAKKLNEEATIAFKQAANIREEANSLTSNGAKLGSLSNAEEIEAGALIKQQQAIELLKKSNPTFVLKTVSSSPTETLATKSENLDAKLETVNNGINELANAKITSFQKLYEANNTEIEQTIASINANQTTLNKTPGLKSEFAASSAKLLTAKTLKQTSDAATLSNDKLLNLTAAIKKQLEVITQLNKVNASLNKIVDKNALLAQQKNNQESTNNPTNQTINEPVKEVTTINNQNTNNITEKIIDISTLSKEDTTAKQLLNYLDNSNAALKNERANAMVNTSLAELKIKEAEIKQIDEKIANYQPSEVKNETPATLKIKADSLLIEAEALSAKAFEAKTEADSKTGEEKDNLLAKSQELDSLAKSKKLNASEFNQKANVIDYKTNEAAITELLTKLKTDNPTLSSDLETKNNEIVQLNTQAKQLREEANALTNNSAKLGSISNVEEKEAELIQKQTQLIAELKKQYPDYEIKTLEPEVETPEILSQKKNQLLEKQYNDLTNLTNAFSLEYETSKNSVPTKLNANQKALKQNATDLNTESKRLLIKAAQETNSNEKIKLLTLSARSGNAAIEQLNKLIPEKLASTKNKNATNELNTIGENINKTNVTPPAGENNLTTTAPTNANRGGRGTVKIEGLEVIRGNAYSDAKPIPIDAKMEDGLTFRVQIGAFKTRLANNSFRGLSPLNGETTLSGYIRYTAGNFNKIENATAVKNDLRKLGYSDAFVVVYYNGKRINLNEALDILAKEGKTVDPSASQTAGITANSNIPKPTTVQNQNIQDNVIVTKELEKINGLLFTVQIGVYTKQITNRQLLNLKPIFTEQLTNGLFRYTAGIYSNVERLTNDKNKVVDLGIKDAFTAAYLNGKRVAYNEGKTRQIEDSTIKMEPENPIVFSAIADVASLVTQPISDNTNGATTSTIQPFKNNVSSYPAATPDNGIKENEEGVSFKVQIGAYTKQVPEDIASKFFQIKNWPVENKLINALFIYNVGNFSEAKFAKALKEEIVQLGISDAFITVYKDGKKLYGAEASALLSK